MQVNQIKNQTILISPLDWGFGHTARCKGLIDKLIEQNNNIIFAGNDLQLKFIKQEYPFIETEYIVGYNVKLTSKRSTYMQIGLQLRSIYNAIKYEKEWVSDFISNRQIDLIISDHRYGFRHPNVKSIFMGHQLNLYLPYFKQIINKKLSHYINCFDLVWVVDDDEIKLAGELSQTNFLSVPYFYIGLINRFKKQNVKINYDYLIIISGAPPENRIFLKQVENIFRNKKVKLAIVSTIESENQISNSEYFYNPNTKKLNLIINQANMVISKLGYTTLMEMVSLKKNAILIPTKGQFEQEYLKNRIHYDFIKIIESIDEI